MLKNALRAGDIRVEGSRQFGNFDDGPIPKATFAALSRTKGLPPAADPRVGHSLETRVFAAVAA